MQPGMNARSQIFILVRMSKYAGTCTELHTCAHDVLLVHKQLQLPSVFQHVHTTCTEAPFTPILSYVKCISIVIRTGSPGKRIKVAIIAYRYKNTDTKYLIIRMWNVVWCMVIIIYFYKDHFLLTQHPAITDTIKNDGMCMYRALRTI